MIATDDEIGTAVSNAAQLAVDEINGAGGVFGLVSCWRWRRLPTRAAPARPRLPIVEAGAGAIIGPVAADAVGPALDEAKGASVPLLALSSAPELSALDGGGGFLFRLMPSLALQMPVLANLALESEATHAFACSTRAARQGRRWPLRSRRRWTSNRPLYGRARRSIPASATTIAAGIVHRLVGLAQLSSISQPISLDRSSKSGTLFG